MRPSMTLLVLALLLLNLLPGRKSDSLTVCKQVKSLNISADVQGRTWSEIEKNLRDELKRENITLAELQECN